MERRFQKSRVLTKLSRRFSFRTKKKNNGRAYKTKIEDNCFEFEANTIYRFVRISFNRLSGFNRLPVVYTTIYQKENDKNVNFRELHLSLIRNRTYQKKFDRISKFELSI